MSLTMSPATRSLVEGALLNKGARSINRITDLSVRESLSATLAARAAAQARMDGIARTSEELAALMLQYPEGYLASIDGAFWYSKQAKQVAAAWRARVALIGFTPSDDALRRMAVLHSALQRTASAYWATPAAEIDLDGTNPHNRFMRKVRANMVGKWRDLAWAAVDAADIWQTAVELVIREARISENTPEDAPAPIPTIGALYRGLNRAYSLERRIAFGSRGPGFVTVDDVSELAYNRAFEMQVARLETMGRVLLTPESLMADSYSDLMGTAPALPGNRELVARYATPLQHHAAVKAAQDDQRKAAQRIEERNNVRRAAALAMAAESTGTDAAAQYGASIVALLVEGNTLTDIAEFFGLTVETVTRHAMTARQTPTAPSEWVVIETRADRMRIVNSYPTRDMATRALLAKSPAREGVEYAITERTPERTTEVETHRMAHWTRNRKPVPLLGSAPDKFSGVKVAA